MSKARLTTGLLIFIGIFLSLASSGIIHFDIERFSKRAQYREALAARPDLRIGGSAPLFDVMVKITAEDVDLATLDVNHSISTSRDGIRDVISGVLHVARVSRPIREEERLNARIAGHRLGEYLLGFDAVALIAHPSKEAFLPSLSFDQIDELFFREGIISWQDLHPALEGAIHPIGTDLKINGSAQLLARKLAKDEFAPYRSDVLVLETDQDVVNKVASNPDAIGFARLSIPHDGCHRIAIGDRLIEAKYPDSLSIRTGSYPLFRPFYAVTSEPMSPIASLLIRRLLGPEGQSRIEEIGCIPFRDF